jgi:tRNA 2-thiouridine synthesizing protein B
MILHTVNKSPFTHLCLKECLQYCSANSSVILIEDGVYAAQTDCSASKLLSARPDIYFYALLADVEARAIGHTLHPNVTLIDDAGFVELVVSHRLVQSWY